MHTTWANDPVNSPNHYTRSHPGMECIELTADTSFCLGNAIKYLWRYHMGETPARLPLFGPRLPRPPHRTRKEPTMSTRIYCDQCGTETSKREALRFSLSGYSANRTSMGQLNDIEIDICPDCAQRLNGLTNGTVHIRRDYRDKLSPYLLEYQPTDPKEDQA